MTKQEEIGEAFTMGVIRLCGQDIPREGRHEACLATMRPSNGWRTTKRQGGVCRLHPSCKPSWQDRSLVLSFRPRAFQIRIPTAGLFQLLHAASEMLIFFTCSFVDWIAAI